MKIKIFRPKNKNGMYDHKNDSFRELLEIWKEEGKIDLIDTDCKHVWLNEIGDVLLYDRPTLRWLEPDLNYNLGLFGNPELPDNGKNNHHWIFWGRHPKLLKNIKNLKEKINDIVFIGNIENEEQLKYRNLNLYENIGRFELNVSKEHKYSCEDYLDIISGYRYGLSLRGYGGKCHREIELMRYGTVPIFTDENNLDYFNPLEENKHYLKINDLENIQDKIKDISDKKFNEMSKNCIEWYNNNCSSEGAFNLTMSIIKTKQKEKLESICTLVTEKSEQDFIQLLGSIRKHFNNMKVYVLCDSKIYNKYSRDDKDIYFYNDKING